MQSLDREIAKQPIIQRVSANTAMQTFGGVGTATTLGSGIGTLLPAIRGKYEVSFLLVDLHGAICRLLHPFCGGLEGSGIQQGSWGGVLASSTVFAVFAL